jgi:hypothetical protein
MPLLITEKYHQSLAKTNFLRTSQQPSKSGKTNFLRKKSKTQKDWQKKNQAQHSLIFIYPELLWNGQQTMGFDAQVPSVCRFDSSQLQPSAQPQRYTQLNACKAPTVGEPPDGAPTGSRTSPLSQCVGQVASTVSTPLHCDRISFCLQQQAYCLE